ncbi:MAG: alpha/beta fold hydrolase [Candidatus Marinimicrobia bacterium]|jgi:pimeloyl-ACP methyl ester carboxylesterase|nr:alpha/beta fold hydrolase [Candidatus Neomarinimicrobiota bacterium]MBT3575162.1 alpha/beta fold hydrolase [Candidatus Neomarinimicrobiota bacterium]MBT3681051.1 alpha/beta fold hydrolase [Candidatus Neomarinimicrobiota bacterium]MBT3951444.1 alpha/beta fold hydrolase [Candidatus Neomarinimicrobiota bacterium]MBT4252876.1 alpha/beta fold hydrolase [Candidatus Neomarinimicrobiota bacterium]
MRLHHRKYGEGEPLIILHGLFGSSDNWHTLARRWGQSFQVFTLDQRNHGSSPHESAMNYAELTQDLHQFIAQERLENVHIVGHSMGGKVGMRFASHNPDMVKSLTVLDIGLDRVEGKHDLILKALSAINPDEFSSRDEIKMELQNLIPSPPIQQFLLKNILRRLDGSLAWKFNRDALLDHYNDLTMNLELEQSFIGSVLFLRGENSDYLEPSLPTEILQYFPLAQIQTVEGAGHWLHADKPDVLSTLVLDFIS